MGEATVILLRGVISFITLLIVTRILGKTQVSQMSFYEYVTGITLGSIAADLTTNLATRPWPVFVGLLTWFVLTLATQYTTLKSRWLAKMMDGEPVVVIANGQVLEGNLRKLRLRESELTSLLRIQGVFDIKSVEYAVMEPRGELSVLKRSQERPVTPKDLQIPTQYEGLGIELIIDGEVMEQNLQRLHVNRAWLLAKLAEQGIDSIDQVFLAVLDSQGKLYIDRYQDRVANTDDMSDYPGPN